MKRFEIYKNIRKRAMIMGLPISLFALQMTSVIGSLLFVIFSFSLVVIIAVIVINITLFLVLTHLTKNPALLNYEKVFPIMICNKKGTLVSYEED